MIKVRQAEYRDLPWLRQELKRFAEFYNTQHSLFSDDPAEVDQAIAALLENNIFFIAEKVIDRLFKDQTAPVGFIVGHLGPHPYRPRITVLAELFWWVSPEHRGGAAGAVLFKAFEEFGKQHAQWILMTLEDRSPIDPASLEKRGYRQIERTYLKEIV